MTRRVDVAVVGGGIVGLAHAWVAARRGHSVALFERGPKAELASARNFGMIWPIGQPPGERHRVAMRSRQLWLELKAAAGVQLAECGSAHAAHAADERQVLEEFAATAPGLGVACELYDPAEAVRRFPAVNPDGLEGVLYSPVECAIDPRQTLAAVTQFLREKHGVEIQFGTAVTTVDMPTVRTAAGDTWHAGVCLVCGGADFETLFPAVYAASGMRRCKLQMMATAPQPGGWRLGPHVAGGLTLAYYPAFGECPTLPELKRRYADTMPEYVKYGIHVMAAQNHLGEVLIGDSHQYDADISPFDDPHIDDLILSYLWKLVRLPDRTVRRRWHGVYAKHPAQVQFTAEPQTGCHILASPGGAGMTLAFGLADEWWERAGK